MPFVIEGRRVDEPARPYVVAEISSNHQQDLGVARELIAAAAAAGADAVKFQTYRPEELASETRAPGAGDLTLRALMGSGLPYAWHADLAVIARDHQVAFLSTPFGLDSARFLVEEIGVPALKIASGDLTYGPLLAYAASTGLPLIVSTGMATMAEVQQMVALHFLEVYQAQRLVLLHCVSTYPCPPEAVNLRAIATLREWFPYLAAVGWSDHTLDIDVIPALAVAQGATVIEKHFCLTRQGNASMDAGHSLEPNEFAEMVHVVRQIAGMLGDGVKQPHVSEQHDRLWARRSPQDWLRPTEEARAHALSP